MASVDSLLFNIASFIAGLFLLEFGADKFIDNTAIVAKRLNVSPTLVGLLTCGAEWEELVVIAFAIGRNEPSLALGNLMGSSIANILASFSLGLLFMKTATFDRSSKIYTTALLALTSVFILVLYVLPTQFKPLAGLVLIGAFVVYVGSVASLIYKGTLAAPEDDSDSDSDSDSESDSDSDSDSDDDDDNDANRSNGHDGDHVTAEKGVLVLDTHNVSSVETEAPRWKAPALVVRKPTRKMAPLRISRPRPKSIWAYIIRLLIGLSALLVSSYIVAHSASTIGHELGLSGTAVGTTILSLATTLPEKFVAIMGGVRRQPGIMVANTVGSNIFLVTLCAGVMFFWGNAAQIEASFTLFEALFMWIAAALILLVVLGGAKRWMACVFLVLYAVFLVVELASGRQADDA